MTRRLDIRGRTKAALAAAKARGVRLGNPAQAAAVAAATAARDETLRPVLSELAGLSNRAVAAELEKRGVPSPSGSPWNHVAVGRAKGRLGLN